MKIKGILPAIVTPFEKDNRTVNEQVFRELLEFDIQKGADGFYVLGATGEGILMDKSERIRGCEIAVDQVKKRKPVIVHIASMNFSEAKELAKKAEEAGADMISALPPLFYHYRDEDIFNYYKELSEATHLPFMIYNHHSANGGMTADTVKKLFELDNVTAVKWTVKDYFEIMKLKNETNGEINIINGPDENLLQGISAGADGGIGTTYNAMIPEYKKLYCEAISGQLNEARATQAKINRVIDVMGKFEAISAAKLMCELLGFQVGDAVYPLRRYTAEEKVLIEKELKKVGWSKENPDVLF